MMAIMSSRKKSSGYVSVMAAGLFGFADFAVGEDAMISENGALTAAEYALHHDMCVNDPVFARWSGLSARGVHLVHDIKGSPSYWLVGLFSGDQIVGFARVMKDGTVAAIGLTCRTPGAPEDCPTQVFAMTQADVQKKIGTALSTPADQTGTTPLLVHDGPPGREVWLVEGRKNGSPYKWFFVGPGGVYERPVGTFSGEDSMCE